MQLTRELTSETKNVKGEHILFHFKDKVEIPKYNCEQIWNINVNFYKKIEITFCYTSR